MSGRREFFVPPVVLDRAGAIPLHRQICRQIGRAIRGGEIPSGTRLPSTRLMARVLGVSRNTVLAAYDELAADDLVRGERGSGMRVKGASARAGGGLFGLRGVIREAGYPARVLAIEDADGNAMYLRF
jgi:DNA-binding GntR family transcriptional regulator